MWERLRPFDCIELSEKQLCTAETQLDRRIVTLYTLRLCTDAALTSAANCLHRQVSRFAGQTAEALCNASTACRKTLQQI